MCKLNKLLIIVLLIGVFGLVGCGEKELDKKETSKEDVKIEEDKKEKTNLTYGETTWEFYGKNGALTSKNVDAEEVFKDFESTIDTKEIYDSIEYTESMLHGVYSLNNKLEDCKILREEAKFEEYTFEENTWTISTIPVTVYLGKENIFCNELNYQYPNEYGNFDEYEIAVIEFLEISIPEERRVFFLCTYEVDGNTITFKDFGMEND